MRLTKYMLVACMTAGATMIGVTSGCAVMRDQSTAGEYVDDATITARVKAKFVESRQVDAAAIQIETLRGTVQLAGFAKSTQEKATAENLAGQVEGVKSVKNDIIVRP